MHTDPRRNPALQLTADVFTAFSIIERGLIVVLVFVAVWTFQFAASCFRWPHEPAFSASLLASANPLAGIEAMALGYVICLLLGSLILARTRHDAGLFTAACGLAALASRGGTIGAALRSHPTHLYLTLLLETLMLLGFTTVAWLALSLVPFPTRPRREVSPRQTVIPVIVAALVQITVTSLLLLMLARTDVMKQSLAAVFCASLLAAIAAHQTVPVSTSFPFWAGTLLTGVVGFAWAVISPGQPAIGLPANPLANIPPLGYASLGAAGALLGYWTSRRWKSAEQQGELPDLIEATDEEIAQSA